MDALPLVLNRTQLDILKDQISQAIANLEQKKQNGQFSKNDEQREQNLLMYGSDEYEKAHARIQAIADQINTQLKNWNGSGDTKSIELALDSYQLRVLRTYLECNMNQFEQETKQLSENIMSQLPEESPQENAD
jgi:multidrug resistance efflux pump